MKKMFVAVVAFCVLCPGGLQAAVNEVLLADWATFTLDVDGDGAADFKGSTSDTQNIALVNYADGNTFTVQNLPGTRPGQGTVGSSFDFANLTELQGDGIYSGSVSINTTLFGALHLAEGASVVFNADSAKPIWAGWRFGTSGTGDNPLTIIGFVLDASNFFTSGGTAPIKLHTHLYGSLSPGDPALTVSLATALGLGGGTAAVGGVLPTTFAFTGPKAGNLTTPTVVGKTYRLHRLTELGSAATVVDTRAGTGSPITFTFDESATGATKVFFYLSES